MTRTFEHQFEPSAELPKGTGSEVELTVKEIEDAGYQEMLQTSGARLSSWSVLDALLQDGVMPFVFKQPLGIAREVKVAASGLFGRFVARAYLTRYMGLTFFGHLGSTKIKLDASENLEISRKKGMKGDLPDWVACTEGLKKLTVAEAKGCHDAGGPHTRLNRAWKQAQRVDVLADGKRLPVKRIAIVTRWASAAGGAKVPIIAVHDPVDEGDPDAPDKLDETAVGLARLHMANLLEPLGFTDLAHSIHSLLIRRRHHPRYNDPFRGSRVGDAISELEEIRPRHIFGRLQTNQSEALIGSFLTRAGPLPAAAVTTGTIRTMQQLDLRPTFIGIQRSVLEAVIRGDPDRIRAATRRERRSHDPGISIDPAGTWIAHLGEGIVIE
jgi:hypothetical protein